MENELMDFTAQANFDFFQYRYMPDEKKKQAFLNNCQGILRSAGRTVLGMLELGWRLAKLKNSGEWKEVINPETRMSFNYSSFEDFSKYAFGFGKTRTSNLLSMAQFVDYDEKINTIVYKRAEYKAMNTSQLVEIAPLPEYQREYFKANMPVKDMRLCKKYISEGPFSEERRQNDFDLLSNARAWTERKQREKDVETARAVDAELKETCEASNELDEIEFYPMEEIEENSDVGILETESEGKYSFSSRGKIRAFLADYDAWETLPGGKCFDELKLYRFKNGVELFVAKGKTSSADTEKPITFYFLSLVAGLRPIKTSKGRLEIWLKENQAVLL